LAKASRSRARREAFLVDGASEVASKEGREGESTVIRSIIRVVGLVVSLVLGHLIARLILHG
jgi:hypothetical protein